MSDSATIAGRRAHPSSGTLHGHQRAGRELGTVARKCGDTCRSLLSRREADDPHDTRVWHAADDCQFAEVFVERHQDRANRGSLLQDLGVAGISWPVARPRNLVASSSDDGTGTAPYAAVKQDLHAAESVNFGSTRSCATKRCA